MNGDLALSRTDFFTNGTFAFGDQTAEPGMDGGFEIANLPVVPLSGGGGGGSPGTCGVGSPLGFGLLFLLYPLLQRRRRAAVFSGS